MKWCPQLDKRIRYIPRCSWYVRRTLSYRSTTPLNTFKLGIVLIEKNNFHFHNIPTLRLILRTMHKFLIYQNITFKSLGFLDLSMTFKVSKFKKLWLFDRRGVSWLQKRRICYRGKGPVPLFFYHSNRPLNNHCSRSFDFCKKRPLCSAKDCSSVFPCFWLRGLFIWTERRYFLLRDTTYYLVPRRIEHKVAMEL